MGRRTVKSHGVADGFDDNSRPAPDEEDAVRELDEDKEEEEGIEERCGAEEATNVCLIELERDAITRLGISTCEVLRSTVRIAPSIDDPPVATV